MMILNMIGPWQLMLILVALFIFIVPTLLALIDVLRNEFNGNDKIVWLLVVLFGSFLGAVLYFIIGRKQRVKQIKH